jgi:phenylacetate-CoA ligase
MAFISRTRIFDLQREYDDSDPGDIYSRQLINLNEQWRKASREIPYYVKLKKERALPDRFHDLEEYARLVPIMTKNQSRGEELQTSYPSPPPDRYRVSGGSTAEPVRMPAWKAESRRSDLNSWLGRSWSGVGPSDRILFYWGERQRLGQGFRSRIDRRWRWIKDMVQNYRRIPCFDLTDEAVRRAGRALLKQRPDCIIGYAYALDRLARVNGDRAGEFGKLNIKCAFGTSEVFPFGDSAKTIADTFSTTVGMAYGAAEVGILAYTTPEDGFRVFWKDYLLELCDDGLGMHQAIVTSLYHRSTPLFRYALGDLLEPGQNPTLAGDRSILTFGGVLGRSDKPVLLPGGRKLHVAVVDFTIMDQEKVTGYQFLCRDKEIELRIQVTAPLGEKEMSSIRERAGKIDREFASLLKIREVDKLVSTATGKRPVIFYHDDKNLVDYP